MYYFNTETIDLVSTDYKAHKIWWEDGKADDRCKIDTNGCPYIILGYDVRECQHGPDRNIKKKIQYKAEKVFNLNKDLYCNLTIQILDNIACVFAISTYK